MKSVFSEPLTTTELLWISGLYGALYINLFYLLSYSYRSGKSISTEENCRTHSVHCCGVCVVSVGISPAGRTRRAATETQQAVRDAARIIGAGDRILSAAADERTRARPERCCGAGGEATSAYSAEARPGNETAASATEKRISEEQRRTEEGGVNTQLQWPFVGRSEIRLLGVWFLLLTLSYRCHYSSCLLQVKFHLVHVLLPAPKWAAQFRTRLRVEMFNT